MKKEAIEHYDRMIAWAEKQNPKHYVNRDNMLDSIGEHWSGMYCNYCKEYHPCAKCPLHVRGKDCCSNLWKIMDFTRTWKVWIKAAKKVRAYISKTPIRGKK